MTDNAEEREMDSRYDGVRDELGARRRQLLGQVGKEEQGLRHQNAPLDPNSIERDEPISSARLKALPTAATCVRCADEAES